MAKAKRQKSWSNTERFWNLYMAFCYPMNESKTYSEAIKRHEHFMATQTIIKKPPKGAQVEKLCLLIHARRIWFGMPTKMPQTIYEYTWMLVQSLFNHYGWIQDAFRIYPRDMDICTIVSMWRKVIAQRFAQINPDAAKIEEASMAARALAAMRCRAFDDAVAIVDAWRRDGHEHDFLRLQGLLHGHKLALKDPCDASTAECFLSVQKAEASGVYEFTWPGKDICDFLYETEEHGRLKFKESLWAEVPDGDRVRLMHDFDTHVSKMASARDIMDDGYKLDESKSHYLEGDNLRVLKLLKPQYDGKVKMIYIDPPYNTGNAFIYNDKFIAQNEMYSHFLLGKIPQLRKADEL